MTQKAGSKKILVLMSGGVDSSVAAALLRAQGYQITGVYLKLWESTAGDRGSDPAETRSSDIGDPCWAQEMRDAARVAAHLGVPFEVWDVTADYKKRVLENFYSEYAAGRTPNPDVLCNSEIKFGVALTRALTEGYDYVATGHYCRKSEIRNPKSETNSKFQTLNSKRILRPTSYVLRTAVDKNKDQSYFLWRLTQDQLRHTMFPIGEYTKPQVRALAKKFGLHNAEKKDSQGVCFLGKIELKEFLRPVVEEKSGPIYDVSGNLLGFHDGLAHFTVGQRHGVNIGDGHGPYFVVEKDLEANALIVANEVDEPKYQAVECTVRNVQFHDLYFINHDACTFTARTRYRSSLQSVRYYHTIQYASTGKVVFDTPQRALAPGQSIVFYDGDQVIGGGVIEGVKFAASLSMPRAICQI